MRIAIRSTSGTIVEREIMTQVVYSFTGSFWSSTITRTNCHAEEPRAWLKQESAISPACRGAAG